MASLVWINDHKGRMRAIRVELRPNSTEDPKRPRLVRFEPLIQPADKIGHLQGHGQAQTLTAEQARSLAFALETAAGEAEMTDYRRLTRAIDSLQAIDGEIGEVIGREVRGLLDVVAKINDGEF